MSSSSFDYIWKKIQGRRIVNNYAVHIPTNMGNWYPLKCIRLTHLSILHVFIILILRNQLWGLKKLGRYNHNSNCSITIWGRRKPSYSLQLWICEFTHGTEIGICLFEREIANIKQIKNRRNTRQPRTQIKIQVYKMWKLITTFRATKNNNRNKEEAEKMRRNTN